MPQSSVLKSAGFALVWLLSACGGGTPETSTTPPIITPPTVSITSPSAALVTKGNAAIAVAVTGAPDTVVLLKDGAALATLTGPGYTYTWNTSLEAERAYQITAKASKAGTADVVSAARQITVDRTAPVALSRLPASGASDVSLTSEISVTFNEPILASSVNAQSAQLRIAGNAVASIATLDAAGTKLTLAFASAPALPTTVTVALVGLTDEAGNVAVIADSGFTMPAAAAPSSGSIELSLPAPTLTALTANDVGDSWIFNVYLNNTSVRIDRDTVKLYFDGKEFINGILSDDQSAACRSVANRICFIIRTNELDSFFNGTYSVIARATLINGVSLESPPKQLTINVPNAAAGVSWVQGFGTTGTVTTITTPAILTAPSPFFVPQPGEFISASQSTGTPGAYESVFIKKVPYQAIDLGGGAWRTITFGGYAGNVSGNTNDRINVQVRTCPLDINASCSLTNSYTALTNGSTFRMSPPYIPDGNYAEIKVTFTSAGRNSGSYIGNVFAGR